MDSTRVSVVIPTYGRPDNLTCAIDSALSQDFDSFEVIVVDDNNPQDQARALTEKLMADYMSDSRVNYIRHEKNKNGAAARNTGIFAAKGKYIAFLDDDDIFLPQHIAHEYSYLESHPEHSGAYTWRIQKDVVYRPTYEGDLSALLLTGHYCAPTPSLMIRRDVLLKLGGFNENYRRHQDLELMLRFFEHHTFGVVREVLTQVGDSDGSNDLHCEQLEALKDGFLAEFSYVIERLEKNTPGIKRKIICENYVRVWADYLHRSTPGKSFAVYKKYASRYPFYFTLTCIKYVFRAAWIKLSKKLSSVFKG